MAKKVSLIGIKFGLLTVMDKTDLRTNDGTVVWNCVCECGNKINVPTGSLKTGNTKSCGCLTRRFIDISGKRFGKLTAKKCTGEIHTDHTYVWECICDCGNKVLISKGNLRDGKGSIKSCGCLLSIPNEFIVENNLAILIITSAKKDKKIFVKIDIDDIEAIKKYTWHENYNYIKTFIAGKRVKLHRFLLNPMNDQEVDHVNGDTLDNRKHNLRVVSSHQNSMNIRKCRGKSKYKGVHWRKERSRWVASIRFNGKLITLGNFKNEDEAANAYNIKAIELFGEHARLNEIGDE